MRQARQASRRLSHEDALLMLCRSLIRITLIASLTYSQGSAFSGTGARFLGDRKRRRGKEVLSSSPSNYSEKVIGECAVFEWSKQSDTLNNQGFNAQSFASSNCWGCRPFIFRGAFDPTLLLCPGRDEVDTDESHAWPSWEDVVEIAADDDSEARYVGKSFEQTSRKGPFFCLEYLSELHFIFCQTANIPGLYHMCPVITHHLNYHGDH